MIDLSTMVGRVISPTNRRLAAVRDKVIHGASLVPTLKRYILEMRFKPMPRYEQGAVFHPEPRAESSPAGTLFIQPRVDTRDRQNVLLDDVLGTGFAVLCWSNNPRALLGDEAFGRWKALGASFVAVRPMTQLCWTGHDDHDVVVVGDRTGALKAWFDAHTDSVLFLRPDRCIAGACIAQRAADMSASLFKVLYLTAGGGSSSDGADPLLYVPQPTTESSGTVAGSS
jgi:3-(3-hydroxy-phenyl)propionate hydroxylase